MICIVSGYDPELLTGNKAEQSTVVSTVGGAGAVAVASSRTVFTCPSSTTTSTTQAKPPQHSARPLTGRKAASTPSIPEATTGEIQSMTTKSLMVKYA